MSPQQPIRLWPAVAILVLQAVGLGLTITPSIQNATRFLFMMAGPMVCLLLFLGWLGFFSRLQWKERLGTLGALVVVVALVGFLAHPSVRVAVWIYGVPLALVATTVALAQTRSQGSARRLSTVVGGLALALGGLTLIRLGGFTGAYLPEPSWRWAPNIEDTLAERVSPSAGATAWTTTDAEWPGFRGPDLLGSAPGPSSPLNWDRNAPAELWRVPLGPGWSSFAEASGRLFTQEQRGDQEAITSYDTATGELVWSHGVTARFDEVVSGAGPRATPAVADGRVFALGATAILSALDANNGELLWRHELMETVDAPLPVWGFSGSPLVVRDVARGDTQGGAGGLQDLVIVYAGGVDDQGLLAFDTVTGDPVWQVASRGMNFSSPQEVTLSGQRLVLFADGSGVLGIEPATGETLWRFTPENWGGPPMVQFQPLGPSDFVVALGDGAGVARIEATQTDGPWSLREVWTSRGLKPSYNDFVLHEGFLYGFDQNLFACIDATDGQRRWKRGRYGFGQVVLLEQTGQLLIAAEDGDVVLLDADPNRHVELTRIPVLNGKTWNHPIVAGSRLILRNGEEAVSLELG